MAILLWYFHFVRSATQMNTNAHVKRAQKYDKMKNTQQKSPRIWSNVQKLRIIYDSLWRILCIKQHTYEQDKKKNLKKNSTQLQKTTAITITIRTTTIIIISTISSNRSTKILRRKKKQCATRREVDVARNGITNKKKNQPNLLK